jgi:hypothetical protein
VKALFHARPTSNADLNIAQEAIADAFEVVTEELRSLETPTVAVRRVSSAYALVPAADAFVLCDASGGAFSVSLPGAQLYPGRVFSVKKTDASGNAVTVVDGGGGLVDGAASVSLATQGMSRRFVSDGAGWWSESGVG